MVSGHDFFIIVQGLSPIRNVLITDNICIPLLHPKIYSAVFVIVCNRQNSSVVLLVATVLWKFVEISGLMKAYHQGEGFEGILAQQFLGYVSYVPGGLSNRSYLPTMKGSWMCMVSVYFPKVH